MAITIKTKYIAIGVILSLLLTFGGGWYYGHAKEKKRAEITSNALRNEIQRLAVQINDTEYALTRAEQELITERELRKQDIFEKKDLKALNLKHVSEISRLNLRVDTLLADISHNGEIISILDSQITNRDTIEDSVSHKAIRLPFDFYKKDLWLDLKGRFDDNGKLGIDLKMNMDVDVITGVAKTKERTVNILTDNPYIGVINVRSYKTDVQKPKRMGIGAIIGYGICRNGMSPIVGIGLSYNLITF